jgi:gliding motility-associated-like protein
MKALISKFVWIIVFSGMLFHQGQGQVNLGQGLVAFYPLDSSSVDFSILNVKTVQNNCSDTIGKNNQARTAFYFDGQLANINCSDSNRSITRAVSISAWVKTSSSKTQTIVSKYRNPDNLGYRLFIENGILAFGGNYKGGNYEETPKTVFGPRKKINDGSWHHVVGTVENGKWECWVDCQFYSKKTVSVSGWASFKSDGFLVVGNDHDGFPRLTYNFFKGAIDEVRVYNRVVNTAEKQKLCDINYVQFSAPTVSNDTIVCYGTNLMMNANPDSGIVYWESPKGVVLSSGTSFNARIIQDSVFYVYSVSNGITSDTTVINVGVKMCGALTPGPIVSDTALCEWASLQLVVQSDSGIIHWDSPLGTTVSLGDTFNVTVRQNIEYFVYVEYANGYSDTNSFTVIMKNCWNPIYPPITPHDTLICKDTDVAFQAFRDTGVVFWVDDQGVILDSGASVTISVATNSRIYLYNEVGGNRSDTTSFYITVEECGEEIFPTVFTPNGDGVNDYLYFTIPNATCFNASIYNRWGILVYEITEVGFGWDGHVQHSGGALSDGVYFYVVTYCVSDAEKQQKRGSLTLIR